MRRLAVDNGRSLVIYLLGELVLPVVPPSVNSTMAKRRIPFTILAIALFCRPDLSNLALKLV